jgi:triacylglycerol lipase
MSIDPKDPPSIEPGLAQAIPTWRAAYSDRTCALMAVFCQLAYVPFEQVQPPPTPRSPKLEKAGGRMELTARLATGGFTLIEVFNKDDTQAFLAVSAEFAVLAFRGTTDFADWVTNLNALKTPLPGVAGVSVHRGFLGAYDCCADDILTAVNDHVPPDLGLYITGHSLGGALAQIASAALERDNIAACYTFGSPGSAHPTSIVR